MEGKTRCQSCGMPLSEAFANFGSESDGSRADEYCSICYRDGAFTQPTQTLAEMIESSVENMTSDLHMLEDKARELAGSRIPQLKRWRV